MSSWLKVSTAQSVELGPFIDDADFKTVKTALTIAYTDVQLIFEGGTSPNTKNETSSASHIGGGHYRIALNTTDTAYVGKLRVYVNKSGALPVWRDFMVVTANFYDGLITGNGVIAANVTQLGASSQALNNLKSAVDGTGYNIGGGYITVQQVNGIAANVITATSIATDAIGAAELAADAVTEIANGVLAALPSSFAPAYAGVITGAAVTGTLSSTQATSNLTGYANSSVIGRLLTVTSGSRKGEQVTITAYSSTGGLLTFTALTGAMANGDTFFIA